MVEHDALVLAYSHQKHFPREKDALQMLKKIASVVKPIMRARGWKVGELAEFYPDQHNLLGLNVNRGQKILLRLRYPRDKTLFLSMEEVTDTMLHELSHIVHGPHDGKFHALWNQLRDEHEALIRKGYTGEGFLGEGHRLGGGGGRRIPMHEARRLARAAAERRSVLSAGSGQRLGGAAPRPGTDIRRVIAGAAERRNMPEQGCGNLNHNDKEIKAISETATRNGFRTQAEEDEANEAAIAQALWELVQEDEKAKYGKSYIPASAEHPEGSQPIARSTRDNPNSSTGEASRAQYETQDRNTDSTSPAVSPGTGPTPRPAATVSPDEWACSICTLLNPANYLCCDACASPRTEEQTKQLQQRRKTSKRPRAVVDLTSSPQGKRTATGSAPAGPEPPKPATWQCSWCGKEMERMWWTCAACGRMKDNSR